jgi:hypothetical protein
MSFLNDFNKIKLEDKISLGIEEAKILLSDIHLLALKNKKEEIKDLINTVSLSEILNTLYSEPNRKEKNENIKEANQIINSIISCALSDISYLLLDQIYIYDKNINQTVKNKVLFNIETNMYAKDSVKLFKAYYRYYPEEIKKAKQREDQDIAQNKNRYSDSCINLDYELGPRKMMKQIMEHSDINILKFVLQSEEFKQDLKQKESSFLESDVFYHTTWCVNNLHQHTNKSEGKKNESLECALLVWDSFPENHEQLSQSLISGISSLNKYHEMSSTYAQRVYELNTDFYDTLIVTGILDFNSTVDGDRHYGSYKSSLKDYFDIPEEKLVFFEKKQLERNIESNQAAKKSIKL